MKRKSSTDLVDTLRILLSEGGATHTQAELMKSLAEAGFVVNQSKVSRLLRKMAAIKTISQTGAAGYRLPWEPGPLSTEASLSQLLIDIVHNEVVVIVKTSPGAAAIFARIIDHSADELGILGTTAGDDMVLVVPQSIKNIEKTFKAIKQKLNL